MLRQDRSVVTHDRGALKHVLEFPRVAGPVVLHQALQGLWREGKGPSIAGRDSIKEVLSQGWDVFLALA